MSDSGAFSRVKKLGVPAVIVSLLLCTIPEAFAGTLNVTVQQGTNAGAVVPNALVCLFQTPTSSQQMGQTLATNSTGLATFNLGPNDQTVTAKAWAGGNVRTTKNVILTGNQTVNITLALQGNGTIQNPCLALNSGQPGGGIPPVPPGGTSQSNFERDRMRAAIQTANFFANELYPIFSHSRCLHCHGGVIPGPATTRVNHRDIGSQTCANCHNIAGWHVVSSARFVNLGQPDAARNASITVKPWIEVCNLVRTFNPLFPNDQALVSHVQMDTLIGWAFVPGTAPQRAPAGATPGTQTTLAAKFQQWIALGKPCGLQPAQVGPGMFR